MDKNRSPWAKFDPLTILAAWTQQILLLSLNLRKTRLNDLEYLLETTCCSKLRLFKTILTTR